ncbi:MULTISPECIES: DUF2844 domain-containing protein [unclassified Caballeronia]|uniref:DUF2844 domain-containing protein n=1 Tax=unclassified Caballeronia TaxID=2646786 RepID=UPI0028580D15|nr:MULTISPECIES: DUF2844 domain-containing protein [unclassified Caballeronia]MDR5738619.1 DUF2844 domain-containing protein [Caballeronia sp. LZ016]MDR5811529.1 DUF2844 domain-containing protein [Caballeronia sp. LZ019]
MKKLRHPHRVAGAAIAMTILSGVSPLSHAQLGATGRTADASDGAVVNRSGSGLVTYRETTDAHGVAVRQYVDSTGAVYAVSWRGPAMPDVQALLGAYFQRFREAANASAGDAGLHTSRVMDGELVVENRTRLREFSGRAWLASALPPAVSAADIE